MIKIIIPSILVVALGTVGYMNKDLIHEKYLQSQINQNLNVQSGTVNFCGHSAKNTETPEQLVERVGKQFNGQKTFKEIINTYEKTLADTPEITQLNNKINDWGWQDDEYLTEKIAEYKKIDYMKDSLSELIKVQEYRKSAEYTKDELLSKRDNLRDRLYLEKKEELTISITQIIEQTACELNDDSLIKEKDIIISYFDRTLPESEKSKFDQLNKERINMGLTNAVNPLEAFTQKFAHFINDAVAEIKTIDSNTEVKDQSITNTLTVVSTNAFGKKQRFELGCTANALGVNPIFSSASMSKCFLKKQNETYGKSIYLYKIEMLVEDYDDQDQWNEAKKLFLKEFD